MKGLPAALFVGLFALAWAQCAFATIGTPVDLGSSNQDAAVRVDMTTTADCPVGSLLTVEAHVGITSQTVVVADTAGTPNTYTAEPPVNTATATDRFFYTIVTSDLASGQDINAQWGTTSLTHERILAQCTSGIATSTPLDVAGTWATASAQTISAVSGTLGFPNELVVTFPDEDTANGTLTAGAGFTQTDHMQYGGWSASDFKIVSSCSSVTDAAAISGGTNQNLAINVYSFKAVSAGSCGGASPPSGMTLRGIDYEVRGFSWGDAPPKLDNLLVTESDVAAVLQPIFWRTASAGGGNCPNSGAGFADGCLASPCLGATANIPTAYTGNGITFRPAWDIPGVDTGYYVGVCPSDVLTPVSTATAGSGAGQIPTCASVNTSSHVLNLNSAPCAVSKLDFRAVSNGGHSYGVNVGASGSGFSVTHSWFATTDASCVNPLSGSNSFTTEGTFSANTVDGGMDACNAADPLVTTSNNGTGWVIEYNDFKNYLSHAVEAWQGNTFKYNLCESGMWFDTVHADCYHGGLPGGGISTVSGLALSFNFGYQPAAVSGFPGSDNSLIAFLENFDGTATTLVSPTVDHNAAVAIGATGHRNSTGANTSPGVNYYITMSLVGGTVTNASLIDNYFYLAGATGSCYPGWTSGTIFTGGTFSGNIDSDTGSGDTACNAGP